MIFDGFIMIFHDVVTLYKEDGPPAAVRCVAGGLGGGSRVWPGRLGRTARLVARSGDVEVVSSCFLPNP